LAIPEVGEPQENKDNIKKPKSQTTSNKSSKLNSPRFYNIRVDEIDKFKEKKNHFRIHEEDSSSKSNDTIKEEEEKGELNKNYITKIGNKLK